MKIRMKKGTCILLAAAMLLLLGCSANMQTEQPMLELPGTNWLDTPEQVAAELNLSKEQMLRNQAVVEDMETGEVSDTQWILTAENVTCFGVPAQFVRFAFSRSEDGGDYGLYSVLITFPDDTDMAALRNTMVQTYGAGEEKSEHLLYWSVAPDGILSEDMQQKFMNYVTDDVHEATMSQEDANAYLDMPLVEVKWCDDAFSTADIVPDEFTSNAIYMNAWHWVYLQQNFG